MSARNLFLDCCQPGNRGVLERYGQGAAVEAMTPLVEALEGVWDWMNEVWDKPGQPPLELYQMLAPLMAKIQAKEDPSNG